MNCKDQENCIKYSAGHKRKSHHVRMTVPCIHFNGECLIKDEVKEAYVLLEIQQGEACQIKKIKRLNEKR